MKKLVLFTLLCATTSIFAQYTQIPDVNFESRLIQLGIDSGIPDGQVLTSNINTLTTLNVAGNSITNLEGIQDFVLLTSLFCYQNQLTSLDVRSLTALEYLNCSNNQLKSLDVSTNTALSTLRCHDNQLTSLDVSTNTALEYLVCSDNQLTELDVSTNTALEYLGCDDNQLTELDVSTNTALEFLGCDSNQLTSLNVSTNTALITLSCSKNLLASLNVSSLTALTTFYCEFNLLTSLDVSTLAALEYLDCQINQLTSLNVSTLTALKWLDCWYNQLTTLDVSTNTALISLRCNNNQLTDLNIKNTNNSNLDANFSSFIENPNLTCIQVDNKAYSDTNWASIKDAIATYSEDCASLSNENMVLAKVSIFPNPTKGHLNIHNISADNITVYSLLGQIVTTQKIDSVAKNHVIDLSGLPKGIYLVSIKFEEVVVVEKVIVN